MNKTFIVKEPKLVVAIPNGSYTGKIVKVEYRDQPFQYADVEISLDTIKDAVVTASYSSKDLSPTSAFGKFLTQFQELKVGETINPEAILIGQSVALMIMNVPGKKDASKSYPSIVKGTVMAIRKQ